MCIDYCGIIILNQEKSTCNKLEDAVAIRNKCLIVCVRKSMSSFRYYEKTIR